MALRNEEDMATIKRDSTQSFVRNKVLRLYYKDSKNGDPNTEGNPIKTTISLKDIMWLVFFDVKLINFNKFTEILQTLLKNSIVLASTT